MPSGETASGRRLVVVAAFLLLVAGVAVPALAQEGTTTPTGTPTGTAQGASGGSGPAGIVVDADGGGEYTNVTAAVRAAGPGDTVRVTPGTYTGPVRIDESITLVAPQGAVLDGRDGEGNAGVVVVGDAAPTVRGFTLVGYTVGVEAYATTGDWTVRNVTIADSGRVGVYAARSTGDWTVAETTVSGTDGVAVGAFAARGDWQLERVTITGTEGVGINARASAGDWTVASTEINGTTAGSTLSTSWAGTAVYAAGTRGKWVVDGSAFADNAAPVVNGTGAAPSGDATKNYWSSAASNGSGAADGTCVGAVDCGSTLPVRPTGAVGDPSAQLRAGAGGGGLPLVGIAVAVVAVLGVVGGGFLVVQYVGPDAVLGPLEGVIGGVLSNGGGGARQIAIENVGDESVTCRVECLTDDGVEFQYDLTLDSGESREARELPGNSRFAVKVQVDAADAAAEFDSPTDVIVQVVPGDCEVAAV
ncbi:hypothetical protein [Halobaculum sp. MBLA0143]|uniref:hypothetical protein n=1 Tax=Halobaculum sp. MBLA0143 TaxID=3079933 RepID=UPI0035258353